MRFIDKISFEMRYIISEIADYIMPFVGGAIFGLILAAMIFYAI